MALMKETSPQALKKKQDFNLKVEQNSNDASFLKKKMAIQFNGFQFWVHISLKSVLEHFYKNIG